MSYTYALAAVAATALVAFLRTRLSELVDPKSLPAGLRSLLALAALVAGCSDTGGLLGGEGSGGATNSAPSCKTVADCNPHLCDGMDCCGLACDDAWTTGHIECHTAPLPPDAACSYGPCAGHCMGSPATVCVFDVSLGCDDAGTNCACMGPAMDGGL